LWLIVRGFNVLDDNADGCLHASTKSRTVVRVARSHEVCAI